MVKDIQQRLRDYEIPVIDENRDKAAVLIPIMDLDEPEVVLTLRASRLDAHAGEVAWPGGRMDDDDEDLIFTALRESEEEIGLPPSAVEIVGELRPFISKFGLHVTPYIGLITEPVDLVANPDELDAIFTVPINYLMDDPRTETNVISRHGETHIVPVYHYDGFRIWGLTAMILREFLVHAMGADIS